MYALRKSDANQSIVHNGAIVLHNNTLHNTKKDTILYNDTLSDTKKDSFLVSIDRNRGNSKKRKLEYVNWKGCPSLAHYANRRPGSCSDVLKHF